MPTNLSPEYYEADKRYRAAQSDDERLSALREMLSSIPKHKGTEKMQADLKSRIAKLRQQVSKGGGRKKGYDPSHVRRDGAGQVVLVGAPNAGKSALVDALTNATPEVAAYPYTTQKPQPAMMPFENTQVQLVDAPPVSREYMPGWLANLVRLADQAALVADVGSDAVLDDVAEVLEVLSERRVQLVRGPVPDRDVVARVVEVPTVMLATKVDRPDAEERLEILGEFFGDQFEILPCSVEQPDTLESVRQRLFRLLDVIRVCTKQPGKPPDLDQPYVLPAGSTVLDLAFKIHKDLARNLKYARIWGDGMYDGQRVQRDHVLRDMDILELRD